MSNPELVSAIAAGRDSAYPRKFGARERQVLEAAKEYIDTQVAAVAPEIGGAVGNSPVSGGLLYTDASDTLAQEASVLFWDAANNRLGVGTNAPLTELHVAGPTAGGHVQFTITSSADSNMRLTMRVDGSGQGFIQPLENGTDYRNLMLCVDGGNVGVGTNSPTAKLDVDSDVLRLRTSKTPASADATGNAGDVCWDADYVYVCVATDTWKRAALATW